MPRVKRGFKARQRRNKVLKLAKGYRGCPSCRPRPTESVQLRVRTCRLTCDVAIGLAFDAILSHLMRATRKWA